MECEGTYTQESLVGAVGSRSDKLSYTGSSSCGWSTCYKFCEWQEPAASRSKCSLMALSFVSARMASRERKTHRALRGQRFVCVVSLDTGQRNRIENPDRPDHLLEPPCVRHSWSDSICPSDLE